MLRIGFDKKKPFIDHNSLIFILILLNILKNVSKILANFSKNEIYFEISKKAAKMGTEQKEIGLSF